jgi:hypothetical protein
MKRNFTLLLVITTMLAGISEVYAQNKNYSAYCVGTRMKNDCDYIGDEDGRFSVQISDNINYSVWYRAGDGTGNLNKCLMCNGDANVTNGHTCNWNILLVSKTDVNVSTLRLSFRATDDDAMTTVNDWWMDDDCTYTQNGYDVALSSLAPGQNHYIEIGQTTSPQWYVTYRITWSWVSVNTPSTPVAAQNPACGNTSIQSITSNQADVTWYWQGTNPNGTSTANPSTSPYPVSATGVYYLRAKGNSNNVWSNNSSSVYVIIETLSTDPSSVNIANNNTPPGTMKTLSVNGGSLGTSAEWHWYDDVACTNHIDTGNFIIVDPMVNTTYYARAEGNCDTTLTASATVMVDLSSAEEIMPSDDAFRIMPVPASDYLIAQCPFSFSSEDIFLTISDMTGRIVLSKKMERDAETIDISGIENGIYVGVFRTPEKKIVRRIIVSH